MHPWGLLLLVSLFFIQVCARPWNLAPVRSRKNDLKQLKRANTKPGDRFAEVEPPGSREFRAEHFGYLLLALLESRQPVLHCFCIVEPQVFDIQDGQIRGSKTCMTSPSVGA